MARPGPSLGAPSASVFVSLCGDGKITRRRSAIAIQLTQGEFPMRKTAFALAAAAALFSPLSAYSQQIEIGPGGVHIDGDREGVRHRDGECEQLRRACEHKDELGDQGEGNCRRYRETCR
jgi:hypothetical protein